MSGIVSGLGKVFSTVASTVSNVGRAVMGVGATLFTGGAATRAGSMASGGLSGLAQSFGGGTLGNVLTGAITQAGIGALAGGVIGAATGQGFGKGALFGGLAGAVTGGLGGLTGVNAAQVDTGITTGSTSTGLAPTGNTAAPQVSSAPIGTPQAAPQAPAGPVVAPTAAQVAASAPSGLMGGIGSFLRENGGALLMGAGQGISGYMQAKEKRDSEQADRQFLLDKEMRVRDSYNVPSTALAGGTPYTPPQRTDRPKPQQRFGRGKAGYEYDPGVGQIVWKEA